ncbi:Rrf2 family transcriptional regulator [Staphylococcus arlettae]|uniref:RrF2 family transcriptional regulator n=1 Tax=Staphylococcus arlettae TaxID=29378 RepID=UPI000E6A5D37|nr:Rrf2 family transcriptional regulator [Staphylococcus arlettae]RIM68397.1 Rrf2 family transcriptional regulator [Staphylococcus arlettae]RIM72523.1 Rrf2 family transcriptional regulator [Staphylococcus arlettae]RIM78560.1 Rrf2 family transcriptional regulator [Staphylococcus arlettae]
MKITKGSDYALHALAYLIATKSSQAVNVQTLANKLNVSVTYLSKILTQLTKANVIKSSSGARGGYSLVQQWEDISIYTIITAIDGHQSAFEDSFNHGPECKIQKIIVSAEDEMTKALQEKTLKDLI